VESKARTLQTLFLVYRSGTVTDYLNFRNCWKENFYFHSDSLEQLQSTVKAEETLLPVFQFCTVLVNRRNGTTNAESYQVTTPYSWTKNFRLFIAGKLFGFPPRTSLPKRQKENPTDRNRKVWTPCSHRWLDSPSGVWWWRQVPYFPQARASRW
jgi:hypothetical protein